jgi:hypothetical protein
MTGAMRLLLTNSASPLLHSQTPEWRGSGGGPPLRRTPCDSTSQPAAAGTTSCQVHLTLHVPTSVFVNGHICQQDAIFR